MILRIILRYFAGILLSLSGASGVLAADSDPLFADFSTLEVTIAAPMQQLMTDRPEEEYVPATFEYATADGSKRSFDIGIRTRGEFRRRPDICPFAPLRINFQKSQLEGSIFDNQDKLKLVTHCHSGSDRYDQTVVAEYLAYRILNLMTDSSFRVRLMRVKYVYQDKENRIVEHYAILIEHKDRLAARLELEEKTVESTTVRSLHGEHTNLVSVFEYMIGNTDYSPVAGAVGEQCCHNTVIFGKEEPPFVSIPYDFDQAGFVNAPHARPGTRFDLRNVRERLYRGRCVNNELLPDTLALFREKRGEIETIVNEQAGVKNSTRKSMLTFVKSFYKVLDNEKSIDKWLVKACI